MTDQIQDSPTTPAPHPAHPRAYRGWRSTKLHLSLITMALICGGYVLTGHRAEEFSSFCTFLLAAAAIYSGAAVLEKPKC